MRAMEKKTINIVVPVYNEEARLGNTVQAYYDHFYSATSKGDFAERYQLKLYVVNDGSTDNTLEIAHKLLADLKMPAQILSYTPNRGKGHAVRYGVLNSDPADFYYLADADLSSGWQTLEKLMSVAETGNYDCVIGSRSMSDSEVQTALKRLVSGRLSNLLIKLSLGLPYRDTQCGYKLFAASCLPAFKQQQLNKFGFDFELLYIFKLLGLKVKEVGVKWVNMEGSKVRLSDYTRTFDELMYVRNHKYDVNGTTH
jgi:dolichyl-phosphate beta-glucosyltransferase